MKYRICAIVIAAVVFITGCGSNQPESTQPTNAPSALPNGMGSNAADGVFPRTVTHFAGQTEISAQPTRIAIISTGQLDVLLSLDIVPVAATRAQGADLTPDYLRQAFPADGEALDKMIDVGTRKEPSFEAVADAKPDLILVNQIGVGSNYDRLTAIAPTVVTEGTGVNWAQDLLLVAAAVGKSGAGQGLIDDIDAQAKAVGAQAGQATFSFVRIQDDRTRIFGVGSFVGSLAERGGLQRPQSQQFNDTSEDLSPEQLQLASGDWIFFSTKDGKAGDLPPENLAKGVGNDKDKFVWVNEDPWYLNAGPAAAKLVLEDISASISSG